MYMLYTTNVQALYRQCTYKVHLINIMKYLYITIFFYLLGFAYVLGSHYQNGYSDDIMSNHYRTVINLVTK